MTFASSASNLMKGYPVELSSTFCREQEIVQHDRAAKTTLQNIRLVAEKAAKAWGAVALAAEQREARHERARIIADMATLQNESVHNEEVAPLTEKRASEAQSP